MQQKCVAVKNSITICHGSGGGLNSKKLFIVNGIFKISDNFNGWKY